MTALELVLGAEEAARRPDSSGSTVAVIVADTAIETLLGLLSASGDHVASDKRDELMNAAVRAVRVAGLKWPAGMGAELKGVHTSRNASVHQGVEQTPSTAALAVATARRLLVMLPLAAPGIPDLPRGATMVTAVATVLAEVEGVSSLLREADASLVAGAHGEAADAAAKAMRSALRRTRPTLMPVRRPIPQILDPDPERTIKPTFRQVFQELDWLSGWTLVTILGIPPAQFVRMQRVLGDVVETFGGAQVYRHEVPTNDDARWAVERVAEIIFRLWVSGLIFQGSDEDFIRRYDEKLRP